jgi:hypothetical protein
MRSPASALLSTKWKKSNTHQKTLNTHFALHPVESIVFIPLRSFGFPLQGVSSNTLALYSYKGLARAAKIWLSSSSRTPVTGYADYCFINKLLTHYLQNSAASSINIAGTHKQINDIRN